MGKYDKEYEVIVDNYDNFKTMLLVLGLKIVYGYEKIRTIY